MATKVARSGRSAEEQAALVARWEQSGLTQRDYCRRQGIAVTTFDYYRRQQLKREAVSLVQVRIAPSQPPVAPDGGDRPGFVLTLRNGRRIQGGWEFPEASLARLVRVAEQA